MALDEFAAEPDITRTVALLGGHRTLHRTVRSRLEAHDLLESGLPGHALKHLVDTIAMLRAAKADSMGKGGRDQPADLSAPAR